MWGGGGGDGGERSVSKKGGIKCVCTRGRGHGWREEGERCGGVGGEMREVGGDECVYECMGRRGHGWREDKGRGKMWEGGGKINVCKCASVHVWVGEGWVGRREGEVKCSPNQQSCPRVLMRADTLLPDDDFTKGPNGVRWFSNMGKK